MPIKKSAHEITIWIIIILTFGLAFYFYHLFPAFVPTHWDMMGNINGYSSARFAAFFLPCFSLGLYLLLTFIPLIDPERKRYRQFAESYSAIKLTIIGFLTTVYVLIGFNGMGYHVQFELIIPIMVGGLFIIIGRYLRDIKHNWFVGIRTPWTLSSEEVWNKTHKLASQLFVVGGVVMIILALIPAYEKFVSYLVLIALMVIIPIIHSYFLYQASLRKK
jgi:uncharacterized membrane protein